MTALPPNLHDAIEREASRMGMQRLSSAREELSTRYRDKDQHRTIVHSKQGFMESEAHRSAYAVSRMPATFAVIRRVLLELRQRMPQVSFPSLLDLGAGPGTAMWAAADAFPELSQITLIEQDAQLAAMGKRFAATAEHSCVRTAAWQTGDLTEMTQFEPSDLVMMSYVVGEISDPAMLLSRAWEAAQHALVVIEPGTPRGFEKIREIRASLIGKGAHIVAPCPHDAACPMAQGDWCHFAERVERSSSHRQLKKGSLGYEDEKFSYIIAVKGEADRAKARVLRHPLKRSGHVCLVLCTQEEGIQQRIVSRKEGDLYRLARDLEWGDSF